jgi:hypothetical protein
MKTILYVVVGLALFLFRLLYGTTKFGVEDAKQIYLIGLKYFTHGTFPYWGPDVVYTDSRIPGSLQGLLVGWPLHGWTSAISPFVLLNVLSMAALVFFAWYAHRRFPQLPFPLLAIWLLMSPWSLHYSVHIENPSYVLPVAALFFVAVLELLPIYERKLLPVWLSLGLIGFSITWIMQLHLSWVMLLPYTAVVLWFQRAAVRQWPALMMGASLPAMALVPLYLSTDYTSMTGGSEQNIVFNAANLTQLPIIIARFFSYATYETTRFMGATTAERIDFLCRYPWNAIPAILVTGAGIAQWLYLVWAFFKLPPDATWNKIRWLCGLSIAGLYGAFWFSITKPQPHTFVFAYPLAMWYSFYCYNKLAERRWFLPISALILGLGLVFQTTLAHHYNQRWGLHHYQNAFKKAVETHDYTFVGVRRTASFEKKSPAILYYSFIEGETFIDKHFDGRLGKQLFLPQNLVPKLPFDGEKWRWKLDTTFPYSAHYTIPSGSIPGLLSRNNPSLSVRFEYTSERATQVRWVMEIKNGVTPDYWEAATLQVPASPDRNNTIHTSLNIKPDQLQGGVISTYLWLDQPHPEDLIYIHRINYNLSSAPRDTTPQ